MTRAGWYFAPGYPFPEHLERVVARVRELTRDTNTHHAARHYYGTPTGVVPHRVAVLVDALRQRESEYPAQFVDRILTIRGAAVIWYAVLCDMRRCGHKSYSWWAKEHRRLAGFLGQPTPAEEAPTFDLSSRSEIYRLAGDPEGARHPALAGLAERWRESNDGWERLIAVRLSATYGHREVLLDILSGDDPSLMEQAVNGLTGQADTVEIGLLHRIVKQPEPVWRWARRAATRRLTEIGGPRAEAALRDHVLSPLDPPWRRDKRWLEREGRALIPRFIELLADRQWSYDAPFALGELRAQEAVEPLCDMIPRGGVPAIEALGKIASPRAVPALLSCLDDERAEVRDHALRALARIGDPRVVDAAVQACDDLDPVVRDRAARVLFKLGDERAVLALIKLGDGRHAAKAADALARIGDSRALPTLWHLFRTATDKRVLHAAGRALAAIDGPRQYVYGRQRAYIWLLGRRPDWTFPNPQLALAANDPQVRAEAIATLTRRGDTSHDDRIRELTRDPHPRVRAAALRKVG